MPVPKDAADILSRLKEKLQSLTDPQVRHLTAVAFLSGLKPDTAAEVIECLLMETRGLQAVLKAVTDALNHEAWPAKHLDACRRSALVHEQRLALSFLAARDENAEVPDLQARVPEYAKSRPLTLGERKSLARRPSRNLIQLACRDPDPSVIRVLLDNPSLVEDDVVQLAANRKTTSRVLVEISRSARWTRRYRVCVATVRNPATPLHVALRLLPHLRLPDLREIRTDRHLNPTLIRALEDLIQARS